MSSARSKSPDYENVAKIYSEINELQVQWGKELAVNAGVEHGHKVLDMGCGTGELTSYLAELVGNDGHVVGVDPDIERINIAVEKHSYENIIFRQGQSSTKFPHYDEQYFDLHFSNFVFQWLNNYEKKIFVQGAFNCLKPGGKIAIQSHDEQPEIVNEFTKLLGPDSVESNSPTVHLIEKNAAEKLLENIGFRIVSSKYMFKLCEFQNIAQFCSWVYASDYCDARKMSPQSMKNFTNRFQNQDGSLILRDPSIYQIVGLKMHL